MFNLLPESEKKNILNEYRTRRSIVVLIATFFVGLFAVLSIFPSYVLTSIKVKESQRNVEAINSSGIFKEEEKLKEELTFLESKLDVLNLVEEKISVSDLFQTALSHRGEGVRVSSLVFTKGLNKGDANSLELNGVAWSRESLSSLVSRLREDSIFESVEFPVSSLAKDRNTDFSLKIGGNF